MKKSMLIAVGVIGTGIVVMSVLGAGVAFAAVNPTSPLGNLETQIYQKVIDTLHISNVTPDQLSTTLKDSRQQVVVSDITSQIDAALTSGKLTKADADLAKKLIVEEQKLRDANTINPSDLKALSQSERILKIDQQRIDHDKQLLSDLGITEDQLTALQTKLRDAGIRLGGGMMEKGGLGQGMGRGRAGLGGGMRR
ncbi:MAG: hypothetical protein WCK31_02715 [bacterium]